MRQETRSLMETMASDPGGFQDAWVAEIRDSTTAGVASGTERKEVERLFELLIAALRIDPDLGRFDSKPFDAVRTELAALSRSRAIQGFTAGETSQFVMALKRPLFSGLRSQTGDDAQRLFDAVWAASLLVDKMAQWTATTHQRAREDVISRQQAELLELSTPVVKLWDGVLAIPMIGTLDSSRTQVVMETLLTQVVETEAEIAIIDITGVPTVDTMVAQHLLKTVSAIRMMGAEGIISGVRSQIAQTIVHLGIDLHGITTKATLAEALKFAMTLVGSRTRTAKA